jgi:biopolymer transport protein ExbD
VARRHHHYRRRVGEQDDLDMTTFLNLMVALIPFLLVTAVFSRIQIVELSLPSAMSSSSEHAGLRVEVIVREQGLELTNGDDVIAALPLVKGDYDLETLSRLVLSLKQDHPEAEAASVLLEPDIAYDLLIRVMDVVRSAEVAGEGALAPTRVALFTDISVGDAP